MRKIGIIANPRAGRFTSDIVKGVESSIAGLDVELLESYTSVAEPKLYQGIRKKHPTSDMEQLVAEAASKGIRDFVIIGGDGTVNDYANSVIGLCKNEGIKLEEFLAAAVPGGSGDDFARAGLGIASVDESVRLIADYYQGKKSLIRDADVISVEIGDFQSYMINVADASFGAHLSNWVLTHPRIKKALGPNSYSLALFTAFPSYSSPDIELELDGEKMLVRDAFMSNVLNSTDAAGGMYLCPDARVDDSKLDVICASGIKFPPAALLMKAKSGKSIVDDSRMKYLKGASSAIFRAVNGTNLGRLIEIDGEVFEADEDMAKISYQVSPHKLRFLAERG